MDARALSSSVLAEVAPASAGRLARLLAAMLARAGVRTDHLGLVGLSAALLFLLQASDVVVANVAETLFVKRVGPLWLPPAYLVRGLVLLVVLNYVGAAVDRGRRLETLRALIVVAAVVPLALRVLVVTDAPPAYGLTLVLAETIAFALTAVLWTLFADLVPGADARRVAALVAGVGLLGEALGSLASASIASTVGVENLLTVASLLAVGAGLVLQRIAVRMPIRLDVVRSPKLGAPNPRAAYRRLRELSREAADLGRRSALLRLLIATIATAAAVGPLVDFQFQVVANGTFATELDLLAFYGLLKGLLALAAILLQLLAFGWLRREAGVARTLLVLPLAAAASLAVLLGSGGIAGFALVWAMLRLGGAAVDEPARRFLYDLFPPELRGRVEWLASRNGRALAAIGGSAFLVAAYYLGGESTVVAFTAALIGLWLVVATAFRARYGRLVLATSLMNRVDFDQLRPADVSRFLDRAAVRQLERELVSGVPARAQLAIELLQQMRDPRLPAILASSYVRQPPVLRALFLTTLQESLRVAPPNGPGVQSAILGLARLARSRLADPERAALIRIYGESAPRHGVDSADAAELLDHLAASHSTPVHLAVVAARYRLLGGEDGRVALDAALDRALASSDEQDAHLALGEIEDLVRANPAGNAYLLQRYGFMLDDAAGWSARIRAHAVASAARISVAIGEAFPRVDFDARIVRLALDPDPRLAAAALGYLRDERFLSLLDTHVLPNLTAGNHHVRERARDVVRFFGAAAVPALIEVVRSGSRRERMAASRLLGSYPVGRTAHRELIAQEVRALERELANVHDLRSADHAASYALLASRLEEEVAEHVRAVLRLLYADTGDETLIRIERQLWSQDHSLRAAALEALEHATRGVPGARHVRWLVDDAPLAERVRRGRTPAHETPGSIDELLRQCATDGNWVTRLITCHTIGLARRRDLEEVLVGFATDNRAALRTEAESAYERLSGETAPEGTPMTIVERMLLLKETELFRNLEARDLAGIATVLKEVEHEPGETIIREGDRGDFLAIIASGKVEVVKADGKGGQFHIRTMGRPDVVGEIALLEEGPRSASIIAAERSRLVLLSRAEFEALIEEYPGVALGIARVLSRRLQTMTAQAARR